MGLSPAISSLVDATIDTARAAVDLGLTGWVPESLREAAAAPQLWAEYAPLEFFLGLVLIVGVVMLICVLSGLFNAIVLQLTARRVKALGSGDASDPETLKQRLLRAFRASRRLGRLGRRYVGTLQRSGNGEGLVSALPAKELLTTEALAASASKLRSERLLVAIVSVGGAVILIELAVGFVRFRDQLGQAEGRRGLGVLLDPAMSGAVFALGCVILMALSVGVHRVILRLLSASLGRLQTALDDLFYCPGDPALLDGPSLAWPDEAAPMLALARQDMVDGPVLSAPASDRAREAGPLETRDREKFARGVDPEWISAARLTEIRSLIGALAEEVANQRKTLGDVSRRLAAPSENGGAAILERLMAEIRPLVAPLGEELANQRKMLGELINRPAAPAAEGSGKGHERLLTEFRPMMAALAEEVASQRKTLAKIENALAEQRPEDPRAALEAAMSDFRSAIASLVKDVASQGDTLGKVLSGVRALPAEPDRGSREAGAELAKLTEDVAGQRALLGEILTRLDAMPADSAQSSELAQLRKSAGEIKSLTDAMRSAIAQLAAATESLSRVAAPQSTGAAASATAPPPASPPATLPGMVRELRQMLRDVETAEGLAEVDEGEQGR